MKTIYLSVLFTLLTTLGFAQEALITGYVDAPCPGANGRVLEIYVNGTIDLTGWSVERQANGGGFSSSIDLSSLGEVSDSFIYITNDEAIFTSEFAITENIIENSIISSNGDDAFQIVDNNATVIDRFGEEGIDGSGTAWEHEDSYYLRHNQSMANGGNFNASNWMFGALNELDGQGSCNGGDALSTLIALGSFEPQQTAVIPEVTFDDEYIGVNENEGTATLTVSLSEQPSSAVSIEVSVLTNVTTAVANQHYQYTNQTLTFEPSGELSQEINITLPNNEDAEADTMLVLQLSNPVNATLGENEVSVVYIFDDELHAPGFQNTLGMTYTTSYAITGDNPGSEILTHDPETQRLFVMNSGNASVEILDASNPMNISAITSVDLSAYGDEGTSVAYSNGIVAATAVPETVGENGMIAFMDTDGNIITTVEVGFLPDMITFSPDGNKLLVANEGEPNSDYSVDPEGSISVIDLSEGIENLTQTDVTNLDFNDFDTQEEALIAAGVRIFGPDASVSQDLEPEYITVSEDSQKAWVTLQENNAVAVVDLNTLEITDIFPLGMKDHNLPGNEIDTSNKLDFIYMGNWPIKGMYMPDAIANYTVNGTTYFVTANEGDAREYDTYVEETSLEDMDLDPTVFPNKAFLEKNDNLGKIKISSASGDTDGDGDYDEICVFGARSFSIFNGVTGELVYDSGSDFEHIIKEDPVYGAIFNADEDENELKNRSDNKGPEPEAVIVQEINGETYAFIGLERMGGIMVYNISTPEAPYFEGYFNNRNTSPDEDATGDLAPESIIYISPEHNSAGKGLIIAANEVSATLSVYTLENNTLATPSFEKTTQAFIVYPNPVKGDRAFFTSPTDYRLFDLQGRKIKEAKNAAFINTATLTPGTYIIKNAMGLTQKLLVN